jgi:hypothetical protein
MFMTCLWFSFLTCKMQSTKLLQSCMLGRKMGNHSFTCKFSYILPCLMQAVPMYDNVFIFNVN